MLLAPLILSCQLLVSLPGDCADSNRRDYSRGKRSWSASISTLCSSSNQRRLLDGEYNSYQILAPQTPGTPWTVNDSESLATPVRHTAGTESPALHVNTDPIAPSESGDDEPASEQKIPETSFQDMPKTPGMPVAPQTPPSTAGGTRLSVTIPDRPVQFRNVHVVNEEKFLRDLKMVFENGILYWSQANADPWHLHCKHILDELDLIVLE